LSTDDLLTIEFPIFTAENPAPKHPVMSVEEARKLQSREAIEECLNGPKSLSRENDPACGEPAPTAFGGWHATGTGSSITLPGVPGYRARFDRLHLGP